MLLDADNVTAAVGPATCGLGYSTKCRANVWLQLLASPANRIEDTSREQLCQSRPEANGPHYAGKRSTKLGQAKQWALCFFCSPHTTHVRCAGNRRAATLASGAGNDRGTRLASCAGNDRAAILASCNCKAASL